MGSLRLVVFSRAVHSNTSRGALMTPSNVDVSPFTLLSPLTLATTSLSTLFKHFPLSILTHATSGMSSKQILPPRLLCQPVLERSFMLPIISGNATTLKIYRCGSVNSNSEQTKNGERARKTTPPSERLTRSCCAWVRVRPVQLRAQSLSSIVLAFSCLITMTQSVLIFFTVVNLGRNWSRGRR